MGTVPDPPYWRRLLVAARTGAHSRLGGRWGSFRLVVPAVSGLAGLVTSGIGTALVAAVLGIVVWLLFVAVVSLVAAPTEVDRITREQRDSARASLASMTTVAFQLTPQTGSDPGRRSARASLWVENVGQAEARNCRGRLIGLTTVGRERRTNLDVPLAWTQPDHTTDPARKTFYHGAQLEVAAYGTPNFMVPVAASPLDPFDSRGVQLARDADLVLGIEIAPENSLPTVGWFRLKWFSFIQIRQDDGSILHHDLGWDQIEFEDADPQSNSPAISSQVHT